MNTCTVDFILQVKISNNTSKAEYYVDMTAAVRGGSDNGTGAAIVCDQDGPVSPSSTYAYLDGNLSPADSNTAIYRDLNSGAAGSNRVVLTTASQADLAGDGIGVNGEDSAGSIKY